MRTVSSPTCSSCAAQDTPHGTPCDAPVLGHQAGGLAGAGVDDDEAGTHLVRRPHRRRRHRLLPRQERRRLRGGTHRPSALVKASPPASTGAPHPSLSPSGASGSLEGARPEGGQPCCSTTRPTAAVAVGARPGLWGRPPPAPLMTRISGAGRQRNPSDRTGQQMDPPDRAGQQMGAPDCVGPGQPLTPQQERCRHTSCQIQLPQKWAGRKAGPTAHCGWTQKVAREQ